MLYVSVKPTSNSITGENNNVAICCIRGAQSSVSYRVSAENYKIEGASPEDILLLIVECNNRYHLPYTNTKIVRIIERSRQFYREIFAERSRSRFSSDGIYGGWKKKQKDQHDLQMMRRNTKLIHGQEMYPDDSNLAKNWKSNDALG